ncbi:hypothetical protein RB653_007698 [Dictyostelium firmibasis]|uniref:Uncharacterized protein n=1 Tax=Dictyostelium firmibasis TaxID=79012 RepID=A0AAN7TP47_9MYCE
MIPQFEKEGYEEGFKTKLYIKNEKQRNDIYILIHSPKLCGSLSLSKKFEDIANIDSGHYSILIDVEGETDNTNNPIGVECHLINEKKGIGFNSINLIIKQRFKNQNSISSSKSTSTKKAIKVGKFNEEFERRGEYINFLENSFQSFIESRLDNSNSSSFNTTRTGNNNELINCHTFAKYLIEEVFKLKWPLNISMVEEEYPFLNSLTNAQKEAELISC